MNLNESFEYWVYFCKQHVQSPPAIAKNKEDETGRYFIIGDDYSGISIRLEYGVFCVYVVIHSLVEFGASSDNKKDRLNKLTDRKMKAMCKLLNKAIIEN